MTDRPEFVVADDGSWFEVVTSRAAEVLQYVPGSAIVGAEEDGPVLRVPFTQHAGEVLANLRIKHLPRMLWDYEFGGRFTPFTHQYRIAGALSTHSKFFCLADMATGKTLSTLWAIDYLLDAGLIKQVLVICPKSIVRNVWLKEINASFPHRSATVLIHADPLVRRRKATSLSDIHIVNPDGVEICYAEMEGRYDLIVIDESTLYKKYGTRRWRFLRPLVAAASRVWMLTGTPSVQYPLDCFGQVKMMFQNDWEMTEGRFKMMTMQQCTKYRWVPLDTAVDTVHEAMQPAIVVHKRDVLLDLPPITTLTREVEMSVEQKRLMRELRKSAQAQAASGVQISAVHSAALRTKVLQIASGSVYSDDGTVVDIDCKARLAELLDVVTQVRAEDCGTGAPEHKLIIICAFTHVVDRVHAELQKAGFNFAKMYGAVSLKQRERILDSMETTREYDGVVAYPEVLSHGVTLVSCSTTVLFSPFDKAEVALQVQNRMDRPGQKHPMQIIRLSGCSAEDLLFERMDARIDFHKEVVGSYSQFVEAL
jgi:SNF2 family DNA or RNA helicase